MNAKKLDNRIRAAIQETIETLSRMNAVGSVCRADAAVLSQWSDIWEYMNNNNIPAVKIPTSESERE